MLLICQIWDQWHKMSGKNTHTNFFYFWFKNKLPYTRHYNPLLIWNRSWILTIHKVRILQKKLLEKSFLTFKKWVEKIQTAGYNGAGTAFTFSTWLIIKKVLCYSPFSLFQSTNELSVVIPMWPLYLHS